MNRRRFLTSSVPGLAALSVGLTGCGDDTTPERPLIEDPKPPVFVQLPKMQWLTCDPAYTDYRPCVDKTGTIFLFERTPAGTNNDTLLYKVSGIGTACQTATQFLQVPANPPPTYPYSQTRPDWNWTIDQIAFNGAANNKANVDVHIVAPTGKDPSILHDSARYSYPIWSSDGSQLIVYNDSGTATPVKPVSSLVDPDGAIVVANLDGNDTLDVAMFGGFASPQPGNTTHIAFAGQPARATWGDPNPTPAMAVYNQNNNYVYLNRKSSAGVYSSAPLEPKANASAFDPDYQGRAPYWSPDGKWIVFESSRLGGYALFLANVADVTAGTATPIQLTDTAYWAQHAKFFPDGKRLVFTALQTPSTTDGAARGIAIIDISAYIA